MAGQVKAIPDGQHSITPHLMVNNGAEAVAFYKNAFGAEVLGAHYTPDGKLMHAALKIGDSWVMLADEFPGMSDPSPKTLGATTVVINLYSENVDALFDRAVKAGAVVTMPLGNQFWGDRYGQVKDPFGHKWALGQHIEDVAPDEMERRSKEMFAQMANYKKP
jgi:PhnB protein